eukprot:648669_1
MAGHGDLRSKMVSAAIPSPALGKVSSRVEVERLFDHFITSNQAEITLPDIKRVCGHYGYNQNEFASQCFAELKRDANKLGTKELWKTLSDDLDSLDESSTLKLISDLIAFPHLYAFPGDRKGGKVYKSIDSILAAQSGLPLNGKQDSAHVMQIKDLCLSYGKLVFSKKMNVGKWWRGFEGLAHFAFETNGFLASFKACGLCLADFIYKYGSHSNVEQKIAGLLVSHVLHYKAYVGNPQAEVYMHVLLAFARKITSKTLCFFLSSLGEKFKAMKSNSKRCEMIAWSIAQIAPAVQRMDDEAEQQEACDMIGKFITSVYTEWRANNQSPTRHWAAAAYHQLSKYNLDCKLGDKVKDKVNNALAQWDMDALCGEVFPIFDDDDDDGGCPAVEKKKKKKKKTKKKSKKDSAEEEEKKRQRRKKQIRKGQQQQYKMYNKPGYVEEEEEDEEADEEILHEDVIEQNKEILRMNTVRDGLYDPDRDGYVSEEEDKGEEEAVDDVVDEKKKLLSLKQKKFFVVDDVADDSRDNPYFGLCRSELSAFQPLMEWDCVRLKEWLVSMNELSIAGEVDDYLPEYMNGYMFLNVIRFPQEVFVDNLRKSGIKWSDAFVDAMWVAAKEFHSKYLLELGINRVGECCGQIAALKIESHRLSHILQENDIVYDPSYAKQCVRQELTEPAFEELLAVEDSAHPRWTYADAKQLQQLLIRLTDKLEKETLHLIHNEAKYYEAMRKTQVDLRELSTRVELRYKDLEEYNTQLTTQELMLRDLAVKSKHLTAEKNELLNKYAGAVSEKNYYLQQLHIDGKLPYISHLEKLKAEIGRQVDDVTLLDYHKDQIKQSEKHWIDLVRCVEEVFDTTRRQDEDKFEAELTVLFEKELIRAKHHKKSTSSSPHKPRHRKGQKSSKGSAANLSKMMTGGSGSQRSRSARKRKHKRRNSSTGSVLGEDEIEGAVVHNREDNIDIVAVIRKMFAYYIADWPDKPDLLPQFNEKVNELYDVDPKILHYDPVDLNQMSLKRYVEAGKQAQMQQIREEKEAQELLETVKQTLEQHTAVRSTDAQLKEMEKKVKTQQRRDRNKKLLQQQSEKEEEKGNIRPVESDSDEEDEIVYTTPPPPPWNERMSKETEDVVIVLPHPPPPAQRRMGESQEVKEARRKYKESMIRAQQYYADEWTKYQLEKLNYETEYATVQGQYDRMWQRVCEGKITRGFWDGFITQFVPKWRAYHYWLSYGVWHAEKINRLDEETFALYEIGAESNKYSADDIDLWLSWKVGKKHDTQQMGKVSMTNANKMFCIVIDRELQKIYSSSLPSPPQAPPLPPPPPPQQQQQMNPQQMMYQQQLMRQQSMQQQQQRQQQWASMSPQQRQNYMQQQQQYMRQQQQQYYQQYTPQQMQQLYYQQQQQQQMHYQQYQQSQQRNSMNQEMMQMPLPPPPTAAANDMPPLPPPPPTQLESSGQRLRGKMESEDKKKERELRRLARKRRRGIQQMKPSAAQQQANEQANNHNDEDF